MKLPPVLALLCFTATQLVLGNPSLLRATNSISRLGEHISHIRATLETLPVVCTNTTDPLSFYSAAAGLYSKLDSASDALQLHGTFTEEDGKIIFLAVQEILPVINELADGIWTKAAILAELSADEIPASLVDDLILAGPASLHFQRTLGKSLEGTKTRAPKFSRLTETYHALHLSIVGDTVGFEKSREKRQMHCGGGEPGCIPSSANPDFGRIGCSAAVVAVVLGLLRGAL